MKPLYVLLLYVLIIAPVSAKTIVVIGDSLSAGYGIDPDKGWVSLLSKKLNQQGQFKVINLSASGDTSSNGLVKYERALIKYKPDVFIIELGANDGLRGLSVEQLKKNLANILRKSNEVGVKVILLATELPPNYGPVYLKQFKRVFAELSKNFKVPLVPMFLEGIAGNPSLMQSDKLHPNEKAQAMILNNVWPALCPLLLPEVKSC